MQSLLILSLVAGSASIVAPGHGPGHGQCPLLPLPHLFGSDATFPQEDRPSLMLLQVNAEKLEKARRELVAAGSAQTSEVGQLPTAKTLLGQSKGVENDFSKEVTRLEQKVQTVQEELA
eukprot:CAMPEP_0170591260 /NCGR_PEP_ID=MMETSP0224-20130122/12309_1 /TAXON_ID=285029 /ORGANISM="Togula jolla, Strain CCCM 725" /LENGTH=118 /DNA_ID=CAMNT_0010915113 /DNA_START=91 /DNA_END=443 /DNA_ORIENTATION=+